MAFNGSYCRRLVSSKFSFHCFKSIQCVKHACPCTCKCNCLHQRNAANTSSTNTSTNIDVNTILDENYRKKILERMKNDCSHHNDYLMRTLKNPSKSKRKSSAVLIPICKVDGQLSILFTLRSRFLSSHQGQVSFPGGNTSFRDSNSIDTALRECEEEIGFSRKNVQVWSEMKSIPKRDLSAMVTPILGYLGDLDVSKLTKNTNEVDDIFTVTMNHFLIPKHQRYTRWDNQMVSPVFINTKYRIWGMTAMLMDTFLEYCYPQHYTSISRPPVFK